MTEFNDQFFEKKLLNLKETQDSITGLSAWCLQHRDNHKAIVITWLKVLKKVKIDQRLTLFYLANDVIQYSKRKSLQFVESWGTALQKATTLVRDEKVKGKILRLFKIWNERAIYDEVFLSDLCGLLTTNTKKSTTTESSEFQPSVMFEKMKHMETLEDNTNEELTLISESPLNLNDIKNLSNVVKERRTSGLDVDNELEESIAHLKMYMQCLKKEVAERASLIELLDQGESYYESQKKEAKVVSNAYKNFGSRVKTMKRKLDELAISLPSPIPSPDVDAPSPSPHDDIELPGDDSASDVYNPTSLNTTAQYSQYTTSSDTYTPTTTNSNTNNNSQEYTPTSFTAGFSSFIGSATLPFDIKKSLFSSDNDSSAMNTTNDTLNSTDDNKYEGNKIEVIGSAGAAGAPGMVPPPSTPSPNATQSSLPPNPSQSSLESILSLLKQPPPHTTSQQFTPTVDNSQYTPSVTNNNQYTPSSVPNVNPQYTPGPALGNAQYTTAPPVTNARYTPTPPVHTDSYQASSQYTQVASNQYTPAGSNDTYTPNNQYTPSSVQYTPTPAYPANMNIPPPATIPIPPDTTSYNNVTSDSTSYSTSANIPVPPPSYTPRSPSPLPLPPPPMPPALFDLDEEFKTPPWLMNTEPPTQQVGNPLPAKFPTWDALESPASPPPVYNPSQPPPLPPSEYEDSNTVDCDDRTLPVISRLRKDTDQRHNLPDMDHRTTHRNLISLTGSPKIDTDYRGVSRSNSIDQQCDSNGNTLDNTESVDMDLSDDEEAGKTQFKGSFNINTQQKTSAVDTPDSLDIDHALILLDPQAEKILSSINMEALHSLGGGVKPVTTPTELIGEVTPEVTPSGEAISAIGGGVGSVDIPVDTPPLPSATSSPYMRPQRPFMRLPGGPRFRPRPPHFEQPPYRTRGPFNPRGPPRMDRGGFRPRW